MYTAYRVATQTTSQPGFTGVGALQTEHRLANGRGRDNRTHLRNHRRGVEFGFDDVGIALRHPDRDLGPAETSLEGTEQAHGWRGVPYPIMVAAMLKSPISDPV
jgi:hypothetical protein